MKFKLITISLLLLSLAFHCTSQESNNKKLVKYDITYTFNDGIFLNYKQFKNNSPIKFSTTDLPSPSEEAPEEHLISIKSFGYFDKYGIKQNITIQSIWGFCYNDKVYIYWSGDFHLLPYIGSISHFVAKVRVRRNYASDPFYNPNYVYSGSTGYIGTETLQLLMDTETGELYEFNSENVEKLIKDEKKLYEEFSNLRKKKKKEMMFYYIRNYNEKNPIYFPKN